MVVTAATAFDVPQLLLPSARIVRPTHHDDGGDVTEGWGIFNFVYASEGTGAQDHQ